MAVALLATGCGDEDETQPNEKPSAPASADEHGVDNPPGDAIGASPGNPGGNGGADAPADDPFTEGPGGQEASLVAAVRAYVSAINRRDGAAVCGLLAPGALRGVRLPEPEDDCAASVGGSIGHAEPGGPAWQRTRIIRIGTVELNPESGEGRAVTTILSDFAGGREPSIEEDLIYLVRVGGEWRVAKASTTLYRAIGTREVPLSALTPP